MPRVRVATGFDEQGVLDVLRADGDVTGRQPSKARLSRVRTTLRSPDALALVADDDGTVVGVALVEIGRGDGAAADEPGLLHLSLLCVAPASRRHGTGRALVRALLARFTHVSAWAPDGPARALLEAEGFAATGHSGDVRGTSAVHLVHRA